MTSSQRAEVITNMEAIASYPRTRGRSHLDIARLDRDIVMLAEAILALLSDETEDDL
jgi:hypothetical protein